MPSIPYVISGIIKDSESTAEEDAIVIFKTSAGNGNAITNASGQYVFDLADIGYTAGETVTYEIQDKYNNEYVTSTFTVTGENKTLNVTLVVRDDRQPVPTSKATQIANIGGKIVSKNNPLPVIIVQNLDK